MGLTGSKMLRNRGHLLLIFSVRNVKADGNAFRSVVNSEEVAANSNDKSRGHGNYALKKESHYLANLST
jgi:hypothetical protein